MDRVSCFSSRVAFLDDHRFRENSVLTRCGRYVDTWESFESVFDELESEKILPKTK